MTSYPIPDNEETGGITCYMVCIEGTGDAKLAMLISTPYDWWTTHRYFPGGTTSQIVKIPVVSLTIWYVQKELEMPNLKCWNLLYMIDELRVGTFREVPPHRWWRNGWYHMFYGMYRRSWGCQTCNADNYSMWLMNYVQVLSGWYHLTGDEETGGITCYMVYT